jgi:hypothetical protein
MVNGTALREFHRPLSGIPDRPKVLSSLPNPAKLSEIGPRARALVSMTRHHPTRALSRQRLLNAQLMLRTPG